MSQSPATSSSSHFQAIFQAAVKSYQKQTKKDLIAHPLASQLQDCDSTNAILAILHDQVQQFDQSRSGDERLTKWLGPTVNVLNAFSATISAGVGLVGLDCSSKVSLLYGYLQVFSPATVLFTGIGVLLSASTIPSINFGGHSQIGDLIDGAGSCSHQRRARRAIRSHRMVFFATRNLYERVTDCSNDGHNYANTGGSSQDLWDRDKGAKAGISK